MISVIIFSKENKIVNYGLFFAWLCQMISYIAFNIDFPFSCTMDFRYIPITVIIGAIFIGKFSNQIENGNKVCRVFNKLIYYSIIIFVMASFIVFTPIISIPAVFSNYDQSVSCITFIVFTTLK